MKICNVMLATQVVYRRCLGAKSRQWRIQCCTTVAMPECSPNKRLSFHAFANSNIEVAFCSYLEKYEKHFEIFSYFDVLKITLEDSHRIMLTLSMYVCGISISSGSESWDLGPPWSRGQGQHSRQMYARSWTAYIVPTVFRMFAGHALSTYEFGVSSTFEFMTWRTWRRQLCTLFANTFRQSRLSFETYAGLQLMSTVTHTYIIYFNKLCACFRLWYWIDN